MASFFRSISFRIFGVCVGLLIMMVATAVWSASSTDLVHRQFRTLQQSFFPLAETLGQLETVIQSQKVTADFLLYTPDASAVQACLTKAKAQGQAAHALLVRARTLRDKGAQIAGTEHNQLALTRLKPMIAELDYQERRLTKMTEDSCALDASTNQMDITKFQADDVYRQVKQISAEINGVVASGAQNVAENQEIALHVNILIIGSAATVGIMLAWLISRGLTRPIMRLQAGARAVGKGLLDEAHVPVTSRDEIGDVTDAFNSMIVHLREKQRITDTFGQYVDPRIVTGLINGAQHSSSGEKEIATLFFSDMIGFSAIAERLAPSTLVDLVNAYFSEMSQPIRDESGIIDKYIGDAIMAFWVPPFADETRQAELACRAALTQFARLDAFRARVPDLVGLRRDVPLIDFRVGLSTGEVVVGSVGSATARSFTVMGDSVNQASRLERVNKVYGTHILIDHATFSLAGSAIETRQIDDIVVAGRNEPQRIYELAAMAGEIALSQSDMFRIYEEGLDYYRIGNWDRAEKALQAALGLAPEDGPSRTLLTRIATFRQTPPADWTGVWQMTSK